MAISQEFQKHLSSGNLAEAMKLALSEMIELRISTRVVSEDGSADDRPGHQINTRINIVDGDIENEIGSVFLNDGPYSELRSFHAQQVADAQKIIRTNIESLQTLLGLLIQGLNRPSGQEPLTEPIVSDSQGTGEGFMGSGFGTLAVGAAIGTAAIGTAAIGTAVMGTPATETPAAETPAAGIITDGITGAGITGAGTTTTEAVAVNPQEFSQFNATEPIAFESIAPVALTEENQEIEGFSALDGAGDWSDTEDSEFEGEPLGTLTDSEAGSQPLVETFADEPLATLDLGLVSPPASTEAIGDLDLAAPEDLDLATESESLTSSEEAFDLSFSEEPSEVASEELELTENSFSLDDDSEELDLTESSDSFLALDNEEVDLTEPSDSFLTLDSEEDSEPSESFDVLDVVQDSEPYNEPYNELSSETESEADSSLSFGEDLGFETMQPGDQFSLDSDQTLEPISDLEPFSDGLAEDGIATLQEQGFSEPLDQPFDEVFDEPLDDALEAPSSEDDFVLPSFEEPMAGFDIPEDLPDPLADLSFTNFGAVTPEPEAVEQEETLEFMGEDSIAEDLMGEDSIAEDLMGEDSIDADLMGEDLIGEDLMGEDLMGEDSIDADLMGEDSIDEALMGTDLMGEDLMGEDSIDEALMGADLMGEDLGDQDLEDPAIWNLAEEPEIEVETTSETALGLEPEELATDTSEDWNFEMAEPSPTFSLEGTGDEMEASQSLHFDREEPLVGDAMGLADLDAMDSLFQNSDDNFEDQDTAGLTELDPFLDLEDPFDEVEESEEDPFASLDEDAPLFPPPPPRPGR